MPAVIAPSPYSDWVEVNSDDVSVELARTVQGTLYRKHILNKGTLLHPVTGSKIEIDDAFVASLKRNFDDSVCDIVQVPLANDKNEHVENPAANLGEVVGIESDPKSGKVYALVDARKHVGDFGKTLLGASAFLHQDYKNTKTGKRVGPTLLHVAVTNRPYVTGLDPYEAVVAASAEDLGEPVLMRMSGDGQEVFVPRTVDEVLAELHDDHKIDVNALRTQLTAALTAVDETKQLNAVLETRAVTAETKLTSTETKLTQAETKLTQVDSLADRVAAALAGSEEGTKLSDSTAVSSEDVVNAVAELANRNVALSSAQEVSVDRIAALEKRNAESEIDGLISEGRILPAKREAYLTMSLTHRGLFDQIVPDEPIVAMSVEKGAAPLGKEHVKHEINIEEEIARLTNKDHPASKYLNV